MCSPGTGAIGTNYAKYKIDKSVETPMCRMCGENNESVGHLVSECSKLAQKEHKRKHDNVARIVHWELCGKHGLERSEKWYSHEPPQGVSENDEVKLLWDFMIQCDHNYDQEL